MLWLSSLQQATRPILHVLGVKYPSEGIFVSRLLGIVPDTLLADGCITTGGLSMPTETQFLAEALEITDFGV